LLAHIVVHHLEDDRVTIMFKTTQKGHHYCHTNQLRHYHTRDTNHRLYSTKERATVILLDYAWHNRYYERVFQGYIPMEECRIGLQTMMVHHPGLSVYHRYITENLDEILVELWTNGYVERAH
jgi:hypothetical protein